MLRDRKLDAPESGNARVKALRQVFAWAMRRKSDGVTENPAMAVEYLKGKPGGIHSWSVEEVEQFESKHPLGGPARLALALLLLTGQRKSDVIFSAVSTCGTVARIHAAKNKRKSRSHWSCQFYPHCRRHRGQPDRGPHVYGQRLSAVLSHAGFGNKMRQWCDEAGLPHCSAHGLRKAGAAMAAENGASPMSSCPYSDGCTLKEAELYTRAAQQKALAERRMGLLSGTKTK